MIGRVYKIIVSCSNEIYIGSTIRECRARWQEHKHQYNQWKGDEKYSHNKSSFELFEKYGIENCKIILIKEYEVVDKYHLRVFEQLWINKLRPINRLSAFCIQRFYNKDKYQKALQQNPNHLKELYQKNLQRNPNFCKEQYQKNLQRNPNLNKEKIVCECGLEVSKKNTARHKKSKKHIDRMRL